MCVSVLVLRLPTHSPALSPHGVKLGSPGKGGVDHTGSLPETQRAAPALLWIQAELLEGSEGLRGTWGGAVLEIQGLGH